MKLGVIGAGKIIPFHLEAAQKAGFSMHAIMASQNSLNAERLASIFDFKHCYSTLSEFKSNLHSLDALLIAPKSEVLFPLLLELYACGLPILIEKPVFVNLAQLADAKKIGNVENILIGYNRRFYKTILELKSFLDNRPNSVVKLTIPELSGSQNVTSELVKLTISDNVVHMLDLAQFLFGESALDESRLAKAIVKHDYIRVPLSDDGYKFCEITFGYAKNYSIEALDAGARILIKPLENFNKYTEMEILPPDDLVPYKRYSPKNGDIEGDTFREKSDLKPGFGGQYLNFAHFVSTSDSSIAAKLADAIKVSSFAAQIGKRIAYSNSVK
jgi:predicted dehydrogenase